jgi:uncharacterized protein YkwD
MKEYRWVVIGAAWLIVTVLSGGPIAAVDFASNSPTPSQTRNHSFRYEEEFVLEKINQLRRERGLTALKLDTKLQDIARNHSADMAATGYFAHVDPAGRGLKERLGTARPQSRVVAGENIQRNDHADSARIAVESWAQSPSHLQNILDGRYYATGIGVAVNSQGVVFFTQVFLGK